MKIRPDQIEGVQPEQTQRKNKANEPGQAFGDLLNQEVAKSAPAGQAAGVAPPPVVNPLIGAQAAAPVQQIAEDGQAVAGQVESILDKWDNYAEQLAGSEVGLKSAYGTLEEIAGDVAAIRNDRPDLASTHPQLSSIVDEVDALAATEQFKFNRGDYV